MTTLKVWICYQGEQIYLGSYENQETAKKGYEDAQYIISSQRHVDIIASLNLISLTNN